MEQKDFKKGQILYCLWNTGEVDMCVFALGGPGNLFDSIHKTQFNPDGSFHSSFAKSLVGYFEENKSIQWQLATMEQIEQYGYEKHLGAKLQFPEIQPEKAVHLKEQLRWIPLSEQLPPVGKDVVFGRYEYASGERYGTGFITDEGKPPYLYNVRHLWEPTHWCDCLPDAPVSTKKEAVAEPEKKEEQPKPQRVTLEQLLTEPKYRKMSEEELVDVVGNKLLYEDYEELEGGTARPKARVLKEKWAKEEAEKTCIPTELGAVSEKKEVSAQIKSLTAWAIPQPKEGVISTFEHQEPQPAKKPFSVSQDMWEGMSDQLRRTYEEIVKINEGLRNIK